MGTTGAIVNESNTNRIKVGDANNNIGTITISRTINNSTYNYVTLANIGIELITDKNLGNITITRGHKIQTGIGNESIERYYIIPGIGEITSTNSVKTKYFDVELNGLSDLIYFQEVSYGGTTWWTPCFTTIATNVATFNDPEYDTWIYDHPVSFDDKFTLASKNDPLPIELISFEANCSDNYIILNWSTASEINNDYFILEHSTDGISFNSLAILPGSGNTSMLSEYSFIDKTPYIYDNYYRLTQVDFNGTRETFNQIWVNCSNEKIFDIYPIPVDRFEFITICCDVIDNIQITDMLGQNIQFIQNDNKIQISIPGVYLITINNIYTQKIIIK